MRLIILAATAALLSACAGAPTGNAPQSLVDRSALTVQDILSTENDRMDAASVLRRARGALVCPQSFRAAFFAGGAGGNCVLIGRDAAGSWSSPAFYAVGSGSIGFQAGIQDSQTLLLLMSERALNAAIENQFKFGADASLAIAHLGGSLEGATTTNLGADILSFSRSRGLFAGLALEGSVLNAMQEWNAAYYGREVTTRDIVVNMAAHNPGADPLRAALIRFGGQPTPAAAPAPVPAAAPATPARPSRGGISRTPLPAPR
ncbi:lipid-binding SYLF domain-containing protein [Sediminicoccus sp. KRV36]|uniref:lipid-binding SYLF domain-containing protein n=1 Tax=Sediminicoccus sp. KRV36 TaxID=3133721 RepID=UPI00200D3E13|nr:lipid-binding SYLF domain-containing protein [Sediminicoccus rosea]UPY36180.1 lipid-binding SYLF domain-containing protein [Sediminicoccus rosea]